MPVIGCPPHEHICGALNHPLPVDDSLTVVTVGTGAEEPLVHRRNRLLDLQEKRVAGASLNQQHQIHPHTHAADTDNLANHVRDVEARQEAPHGV